VTVPYIDTSALAKWYLNEPQSEAFEEFISTQAGAAISRLGVVEFRCLLARRRRAGEISRKTEDSVQRAFDDDIRQGVLEVYPLEDLHAVGAAGLIARLPGQPLRTLDALHLAIALDHSAKVLATADRVMANAGKSLGLKVVAFF
jgi:uncharacterized protein